MADHLSIPGVARTVLAVASRGGGSWAGEAVAAFGCRFGGVRSFLPAFSRGPFLAAGRAPSSLDAPLAHPHLDVVVREPDAFRAEPVSVAVVSKRYQLVQHGEAVRAVEAALAARDIDPAPLPADVTLSELGTRFACSIQLPDPLAFAEEAGQRMALTVECFNSVDRTVAFQALVGWRRLVCSNGLFVSVRQVYRWAHTPSLRLDDRHLGWSRIGGTMVV